MKTTPQKTKKNRKFTPPIVEEIWNLIRETQDNLKELSASKKETDRLFAEMAASRKETDRHFAELATSKQETNQQLNKYSAEMAASKKETDRHFAELATSKQETNQQLNKHSAEMAASKKETDRHFAELATSKQETNQQLNKYSAEMAASKKETDRHFAELATSKQETNQQLNKYSAEMAASKKETDKKFNIVIGDFGNRWGQLGENLIKGNLAQRLNERGIQVEKVMTNVKNKFTEFDIIAINGKEVVVVEVKATLDPSDVEEFTEEIGNFKTWWPEFKNKTVYGALAFSMKSNKHAKSLAQKRGFFLIEATGDVVIQNKKDFKPRTF